MLENCPYALPVSEPLQETNTKALAASVDDFLSSLNENSFTPEAIWRDTFALTGSIRTFYTARSLFAAWEETSKIHKPTSFKVQGEPSIVGIRDSVWVQLRVIFETRGTPATICSAFLGMVLGKDGKWRIWLLRTILEQLQSQPNVDILAAADENRSPEMGSIVHAPRGKAGAPIQNGHSEEAGNSVVYGDSPRAADTHFQCVVVGGGQAGLSTGGRLQALGVSYLILDSNAEVGDNWRNRYDCAKLHTIREYAHLPFDRTFPGTFPEFLSKEDLAAGYSAWAKRYRINVSLCTTLTSGSWDANREMWNLKINRDGLESQITCSYLVFAVGSGCQVPLIPNYPNRETFKGDVLHSVGYKSADQWVGKCGVVVGTANTAHDIADDMVRVGLESVVMVQRSQTYVVPAEYVREIHNRLFNAHTPTELADRLYFSNPIVLGNLMSREFLHSKAAAEPQRFDALERVGFKLARDGSLTEHIYQRFGGHYIDVGTSAKVARGLIKIKSDSSPVRYVNDGLEFNDGSHLKANVIVFATGFLGNLRILAGKLLGQDVAEQLDDFWGLDDEGELNGAYKPSRHPAFWYHGGDLAQARYYSRFIALQIKAKLLGTPLRVYTKTP